jgi:hypothetical protein
MAEVRDFYKLFEKRVVSLVKERSSTDKDKLLFYLRIYSHLLNAQNLMNTRVNKRSFYFLHIVATLTTKESFKGESHYLKYINGLSREVLSNKARIIKLINKDISSDPLHANTKIITAQNICMLRILKLSRVV